MATVSLKLDKKKADSWLRKLRIAVKSVALSTKKFSDMVAVFVYQDVIDHFEKEMGSKGRWQRWSQAYDIHMIKIGKGTNDILQDSGRLRNNFLPGKYRRQPGRIVWYNNAQTANGFGYAAGHDRGQGKLPKRDFMWLSKEKQKEITKATLRFIGEETGKG